MEHDFLALFEEHYDSIEAYLKRRLADRSTAEELVQETFLQAFDCRATYDPRKADPRAWLFGIATNLLRHHWRSEERGLRAYGRAASRSVDPPDEYDMACARMDAQAGAGVIASALADLSQDDRDVLTLYCFASLGYSEIAAALSIPIGTVKSRLSRARRKVSAQLGAGLSEASDE